MIETRTTKKAETHNNVPFDDGKEAEGEDHGCEDRTHSERDSILLPDVRKLVEDSTIDGFFDG